MFSLASVIRKVIFVNIVFLFLYIHILTDYDTSPAFREGVNHFKERLKALQNSTTLYYDSLSTLLLPIDSQISYNFNEFLNESDTIIGRYATYSSTKSNVLISKFVNLIDTDSFENTCFEGNEYEFDSALSTKSSLQSNHGFEKKILIAHLGGSCSALQKTEMLAKLKPSGVIYYDPRYNALGTLFAFGVQKFNFPVVFISFSDYRNMISSLYPDEDKKKAQGTRFIQISKQDKKLIIFSGDVTDYLILMVPPSSVLLFYTTISLFKIMYKNKKRKLGYLRLVSDKHIYYEDFLIPKSQLKKFEDSMVETPTIQSSLLPSGKNHFINNKYKITKCSICLSSFKKGKSTVYHLDCFHFFHHRCLTNWLLNFKESCPLCKQPVEFNVPTFMGSYGSMSHTFDLETESETSGADESLLTSNNDNADELPESMGYVPLNLSSLYETDDFHASNGNNNGSQSLIIIHTSRSEEIIEFYGHNLQMNFGVNTGNMSDVEWSAVQENSNYGQVRISEHNDSRVSLAADNGYSASEYSAEMV